MVINEIMEWFEMYMPGDYVLVHVKDHGFHFSFPGVVAYCRDESVAVDVMAMGDTDRIEIAEGSMISKRDGESRELTAAGRPWGKKKCSAVYNK